MRLGIPVDPALPPLEEPIEFHDGEPSGYEPERTRITVDTAIGLAALLVSDENATPAHLQWIT